MTLQQVIAAARTLSSRDKLELLETISHDLQQSYVLVEESAAFWSPRSLGEIAQAQDATVITDIRTLIVDFWPDDETADDVNQFVARQRQIDRERKA
jgi:hypothetical protein